MSGTMIPLMGVVPDYVKGQQEWADLNQRALQNQGLATDVAQKQMGLAFQQGFQAPIFRQMGIGMPASVRQAIGPLVQGGIGGGGASGYGAIGGQGGQEGGQQGGMIGASDGGMSTGPNGIMLPGMGVPMPARLAISAMADPGAFAKAYQEHITTRPALIANGIAMATSPQQLQQNVHALWTNGYITSNEAAQYSDWGSRENSIKSLAPATAQMENTTALAREGFTRDAGGNIQAGGPGYAAARGIAANQALGRGVTELRDVRSTDKHGNIIDTQRRADTLSSDIGIPSTGMGPPVQATELPPEAHVFLRTLSPSEAQAPNQRYVPPGSNRPATFDTSKGHPGHGAAGLFQFEPETWSGVAAAANLDPKDMSQANQERGAWYLSQRRYADATGRDLLYDLRRGGREGQINAALQSIWPSLRGGSQENAVGAAFPQRLSDNMATMRAGGVVPPAPQGSPTDASGGSPVGPMAPQQPGNAAAPGAPYTGPVGLGIGKRTLSPENEAALQIATSRQTAQNAADIGQMSKFREETSNAAAMAATQNSTIDQMLAAQGFSGSGPLHAAIFPWESKLDEVAKALNLSSGEHVKNAELLQAQARNLLTQQVKGAAGSMRAYKEWEIAAQGIGGYSTPAEAFPVLLTSRQGLNDWQIAKASAAANTNMTRPQFEAAWNQNVSPMAFVVKRIPDEAAQSIGQAFKNQNRSAEWIDILRQAKMLHEGGLTAFTNRFNGQAPQ